jgi:hypothetical protein
METVFHHTSDACKTGILLEQDIFDKKLVLSCIESTKPLLLVDLSSIGLMRMNFHRRDIIETSHTRYTTTRSLAKNLYVNEPNIQGFQWITRRIDIIKTIVLYKDRIKDDTLVLPSSPVSLLAEPIISRITALAGFLGIHYVPRS